MEKIIVVVKSKKMPLEERYVVKVTELPSFIGAHMTEETVLLIDSVTEYEA